MKPDEGHIPRAKLSVIQDNGNSLSCGFEDLQVYSVVFSYYYIIQMMLAVLSHQQELEADKAKYQAQRRRLCQENAWLRDELSSTQLKLQESEKRVAELEEQNKHLSYLNQIKPFDEDLVGVYYCRRYYDISERRASE